MGQHNAKEETEEDGLNHMKKENIAKVVFVGDYISQKTIILHTYCNQKPYEPDDYYPAIFDNYNMKISFHNHAITLGLWDTAAQEDYDRLRPLTYPDTTIFILLFSLTNKKSFQNVFDK